MTASYQSINPKGVVPTLAHDGQVVIESNDILVYLDLHFPEPALRPADAAERERMSARIAAASAAQPAIKALSHDLLFWKFRVVSDAELGLYAEHHNDASLVAFLHDYAAAGDAWRARVKTGQREMDRALEGLEAALATAPWLAGEDFSLADISWVVNAHRLIQAGYPLDRWPLFRAWYERAAARPAFATAVDWRS